MSAYHKKQKEKRRKNLFRKWHRRVGFSAALFLINLAVTGILLNHSEALELHKHFVKSDWLVNWYGIDAPNKMTCFNTSDKDKPLCQLGEKRTVGNQLLELEAPDLIGVVEYQGFYYVASPEQISLYTRQWELVESVVKDPRLASSISSIGIQSQAITFLAEQPNESIAESNLMNKIIVTAGRQHYIFDSEDLSWTASDIDTASIQTPQPTTDFSLEKLQAIYLDHQINYLKLVQDLHSGRIFNGIGKWATDIVAIIIILLAISGFLAWQKRTKI
jgi:hypothetical protein